MRVSALLVALLLCCPGLFAQPGYAVDFRIQGARLTVKDSRKLVRGVARIRRTLSFRATDDVIIPPPSGGPGDPTLNGAKLTLINGTGSAESDTVDLPAANWARVPISTSQPLEGWRYKEKGDRRISIKIGAKRLKANLRDRGGKTIAYTLNEAAQGSLAVVLEFGISADRYCAAFGGDIKQDFGSADAGCQVTGRFIARRSPAPPVCPDTSAGTGPADACTQWDLLDLLINGQMEHASIPGLAAAIVANGGVAWTGAYGLRKVQPPKPVTVDTAFMLASVSKVVTGTAVMQAVEDGAFALDDDVNSILDFTLDNPRVSGETITVRHLASHTSGLADDDQVWGGYPGQAGSLYVLGDSPIALGTFLQGYYVPGGQWYDPTRNFNASLPGRRYAYSNIAVALAGYLLETGTGTPLDDHCDARIFGPLGMTNTGWHLADHNPNNLAMPYEYLRGQFYKYGHYGYPDYPNGQLRTSVSDLARFLAAFANGGTLDGRRILQQADVNEMFTPQFPAADPEQGLFWFRSRFEGRNLIGHDGGDYGASTDMSLDPATGVGAIILMNVDDSPANFRALQRIKSKLFEIGEGL